MYNDELFIKFCKDRNIKDSTKQGYVSTLLKYIGIFIKNRHKILLQ